VATNAVLERKGARVAFVTSRGFRDLLLLQRQDRRQIYDLAYVKPKPVVERRDCFEVGGRIGADGAVVDALDEAEVGAALIPDLRAGDYEIVAICLIGAYVNPEQEVRLAGLLAQALPGVLITCSHEVSREFREYERASTTSLSAYVQPVIDGYLQRFTDKLEGGGFRGRFSVMQSNGGRLPAEGMRQNAITALFSGPAAGVIGAVRQAARSGFSNLITFDMGGTSTDVCVVADGRPHLAAETEIDGLPVRTPVLDIATVGAGGGSIVWCDDGGMLRVGPESAGADPGPACYGRGGDRPTITDAHVVRGVIRPEAFLGGSMRIDREAARAVFRPLAEKLGLSVEELADNAVRLANANIVRAIQLMSTERGRDPRDYILAPYGGAGPLGAAQIAEELGIPTILVPPNPGVLSAFGLLAADYTKIYSITRRGRVDAAAPDMVRSVFADLKARAEAEFRELSLDGELSFSLTADMRFVGQAFEVPVEVPTAALATLTAADLLRAFSEAHQRIFFHGAGSDRPVEIVAFRLAIVRPLEDMPVIVEPRTGDLGTARTVEIFEAKRTQDCAVIPSTDLADGRTVTGPALVESYTSTTYVPAGWTGAIDANSNFILRKA
jgi:N-methylhydantoinase A